jgi:hypothetical protein
MASWPILYFLSWKVDHFCIFDNMAASEAGVEARDTGEERSSGGEAYSGGRASTNPETNHPQSLNNYLQ